MHHAYAGNRGDLQNQVPGTLRVRAASARRKIFNFWAVKSCLDVLSRKEHLQIFLEDECGLRVTWQDQRDEPVHNPVGGKGLGPRNQEE